MPIELWHDDWMNIPDEELTDALRAWAQKTKLNAGQVDDKELARMQLYVWIRILKELEKLRYVMEQ